MAVFQYIEAAIGGLALLGLIASFAAVEWS